MRLEPVKLEGEIRAAMLAPTPDRPRIEMTTEGTTLKAVRVGQCHFASESYGGLKVLREVEFERANRYRVKGEVPDSGLPPQVDYIEGYTQANQRRDQYDLTKVEVSVEQVEVYIDAQGNVVREVGEEEPPAAPPAKPDDDMPF